MQMRQQAYLYAPLVVPPLAEASGLKMPTMATRSPGLQLSTRSDSSTISTAGHQGSTVQDVKAV
jgi:hypothetical protein